MSGGAATLAACAAVDSGGLVVTGAFCASIDPEKAEERRVLFVALTRARRYCLVALPDDRRGGVVADACASLVSSG